MWILVIIITSAPIGLKGWYELNTFDSYEECEATKEVVRTEMIRHYGVEDFKMVCFIHDNGEKHES